MKQNHKSIECSKQQQFNYLWKSNMKELKNQKKKEERNNQNR